MKNMETKELVKKYDINLEQLEEEQNKLAKLVKIKDAMDFTHATKIAGIDNTFFQNQIVSAIVVLGEENEILYQEYAQRKIKFPYLPGFRAYRELPAMLEAYDKLEEKPDVVLIPGHGIAHPRLGLASHFSIASGGIPTIGLANALIEGCEINGQEILKNKKIVGKSLQTKPGSKPLYMSPGNNISIASAEKIVLKYIVPPHKLPEPLWLAGKYARKIADELLDHRKLPEDLGDGGTT